MNGPADDLFLDVFDSAPHRRLGAGEGLVHAGDPASQVFNIVSGLLMVSRPGLDGRRQVLSFLFPDNFVGLTASERYDFTVEAVTPATVAVCSRAALERRLSEDPQAERAFLRMTYRVLEDLVDLTFSLGQRTARERLAVFVLYLRHRYLLGGGLPTTDDTALLQIELPMSRQDIADFLGLKKETVSRGLARLEAEGLLRREGRHRLRLLQLEGLREVAGVMDFASPARWRG